MTFPQRLHQRTVRRVDLVSAPVFDFRASSSTSTCSTGGSSRRRAAASSCFGVVLSSSGIFIPPLLYLGVAYSADPVRARAPRRRGCGTRKIGLWLLIVGGGRRSALSMLDPNFFLIAAKPDNVPIVAMIFLLGILHLGRAAQGVSERHARSRSAASRGRRRSRTRSSSPGPISSTPRCSA